jgi:HTH-type transcriptional regulator / antitoxin HipB
MNIKSASELGNQIRSARNNLNLKQADLALTAGTGLRFIIDLEKGKPTCQIGKVLDVINTLGIELTLQIDLKRE